MSVAGIIDAMRAAVHPSIRIVWQCLENHANGARWWRMTEREIATELHLSRKTVERAVIALEGKGDDAVRPAVVQVRRCKRRPATFTMLRSYPEGCPKPRHEPEVARRVAPDLTRQNDNSTAELTRQNDDSLFPPVQNPPVEEERGPPALPSAPAPSPAPDFSIHSAEAEEAQPGSPVPDGWEPSPEVQQAAIEAGHTPAEVREELHELETRGRSQPVPADWQPSPGDRVFATGQGLDPDRMAPKFVAHYQANGRKCRDWSAQWRLWCLREPDYQRQPAGSSKPDKKQWLYDSLERRFGRLDAGAAL